jgi:hypothetical protein
MSTVDHKMVALRKRFGDFELLYRAYLEAEEAGQLDRTELLADELVSRNIDLVNLMFGDALRRRQARASRSLDNEPDDDSEMERHRGRRLAISVLKDVVAPLNEKVSTCLVYDLERADKGAAPEILLKPATDNKGSKPLSTTEQARRCCALLVRIESKRQHIGERLVLAKPKPSPEWELYRKWLKLVPHHERQLADEIGRAFHDKRPLTAKQEALWRSLASYSIPLLTCIAKGLDPLIALSAEERAAHGVRGWN